MKTDPVTVPGKEFEERQFRSSRFEDLYRFLPKEKALIIFDIGANIGQLSMKFREMFPAAKIHAFEPTPEAYDKLSRKFRNDGGAATNNLAVSDKTGSTSFYISDEFSKINSVLPRNQVQRKYYKLGLDRSIVVPTITIDDYCKKNGINHINLLKLDIQGGELAALHGARRLLRQGQIDLILTEALFVEIYEGAPKFFEIQAWLDEHEYMLFSLYDPHQAEDGQLVWADAIFISKALHGDHAALFKHADN